MNPTYATRAVAGITLLTVPTIVYGGLTVLSVPMAWGTASSSPRSRLRSFAPATPTPACW
jgi:hypothetical protein